MWSLTHAGLNYQEDNVRMTKALTPYLKQATVQSQKTQCFHVAGLRDYLTKEGGVRNLFTV